MTTKNSTLVANFEATPQVASNSQELHGVLRVAQGTIALAAGDSTDNDIVIPVIVSVFLLFASASKTGLTTISLCATVVLVHLQLCWCAVVKPAPRE